MDYNNDAQWSTTAMYNAYNNNIVATRTKRNVTQHNDYKKLFYLFCDITVGMISQIMNTLPWFHKSQNCEEIFETIYDHLNAHSMIS